MITEKTLFTFSQVISISTFTGNIIAGHRPICIYILIREKSPIKTESQIKNVYPYVAVNWLLHKEHSCQI